MFPIRFGLCLTQTEQNQQHMQHLTDGISLSAEPKRVSRLVFVLRREGSEVMPRVEG